MAVTTVTVTVRMITVQTLNYYKIALLVLLMLALLSLQIFVVAVLLEAGKSKEVNSHSNYWLDMAETLSVDNPDVYEAQAYYYRAQALNGYEVGAAFRVNDVPKERVALELSLKYWQQAQKASPLWPYYQLGAWDVEVLLNSSEQVIQDRLSAILTLAPNERGLDRALLQLSFSAWPKLSQGQKTFMLDRLKNRNHKLLKSVFLIAKAAGNHQAICVNLPWKKIRRLCR